MIGYLLLLIAATQVGLGVWLLTKYVKNQATFWYGLFSFSVAIYVGANGLGFLELLPADLAEHFAWFGGVMTAVFFLPFSFTYPIPKKSVEELLPFVLWPVVLFSAGIFGSEVFIRHNDAISFLEGYGKNQGEFFWFMVFVFSAYWLWSLINLFRSWRWLSGIIKQNVLYVLLGTLASLTVAFVFDIIIPIKQSNPTAYIGSLFTSIWLFVTVYIIVRA